MNYLEARQLGAESEAPGKWNWTTMNDHVIRTARPCAYPDFEWPERFDPLSPPIPTGRERCDHDTREEAERHRYDWDIDRTTFQKIVLRDARQLGRCEHPDCRRWATHQAHHAAGRLDLCRQHATRDALAASRPFMPGMTSIHS